MDAVPYHADWKLAFHTELGLRVHWFGRYAGYPEWFVSTSRLAADMINFFFVERSSCWVNINGREMHLQTGNLLVISGADEFNFWHDPAKPHVSVSACIALQRGSVANALLQCKFQRRYIWRNPTDYTIEFNRVLNAFAGTQPYRELEIAGALFQWLAYVLSEMRIRLDRLVFNERRVVDKILAAETWANSRLKRTISLAEWARAIGWNPVYFGRVFKRETGLCPMEWLNQRRLQVASQYLTNTQKSIAEISEDCGFNSQFYFSRVFRRHFGEPPLKYRQANSF